MSTPAQGPAAQQAANSTLSGVRATSYTTLDQALTPSSSSRGSRHPAYDHTAHNPHNPNSFSPSMTSDGRYMYPQAQDAVAPPYAYTHYSAPPYDTAQYPPNQPRPSRNPSAPSHSPQQQAPPPPPSPYSSHTPAYPQPAYPPPNFGVPQGAPQWPPDGWSYPQPFPPQNPPVQESQTFAPPASRPEVAQPNPPGDPRVHSGAPKLDSRRDERPPRSEVAPPSKVRKTREPDPPAPAPVPANPLGLDFVKLRESFKLIIDTSQTFATDPAHGRPNSTAESLERMLQAAAYGAQALDSASKRVIADGTQKPGERNGGDVEGNSNSAVQNPEQPAPEGQTCLGCKATSTPEWRRGPMGPRTLCNACGLVYAKLIKKRTREPGRARGPQSSKHNNKAPRNDSGQGSSSDEEDSYGGSQDRRSD